MYDEYKSKINVLVEGTKGNVSIVNHEISQLAT